MATIVDLRADATEGPAAFGFRFSQVSWDDYEAMLRIVGDSHIRVTYDRGELEVLSPPRPNQRPKKLLARMVETLTVVLGIPVASCGSWTIRRQDQRQGLEPDECYYIRNQPRIRGKRDLDLAVDPPPDLAIDVDPTGSSLDRQSIYAGLEVPGLWRLDDGKLSILELRPNGRYTETATSPNLPLLTLDRVARFLELAETMDETAWALSFIDWVRRDLAPHHEGWRERQPPRQVT